MALAASLLLFRLATPSSVIEGPAQPVVVVAVTLAACVVVWAPGLAVAALMSGRVAEWMLPAVVVAGSAGAGWLLFWCWFAHPDLGFSATLMCAALSAGVLAWRPIGLCRRTDLRTPLVLALLIAVAYVAIAADRGGISSGPDMIAHRYWVSADNKVPALFADALLHHRHGLKPFLIGDWLSSDRPPLQTGMMMTAYPLAPVAGRLTSGFLLGVAANLLWVLGLWSLLRSTHVAPGRAALVVIAVALVGPMFVNTVYTWPKLLAAALTLAALAALLATRQTPLVCSALVGVCAALALLAHGGALPSLIVLPLLFLTPRRRIPAALLGIASVLAVLVYLPWVGYQRFYDPPGDRVLKWHLAGALAPSKEGPLTAVVHAYQRAGARGTARNKLANLRMLGDPTAWHETVGWWNTGWIHSQVGKLRMLQLTRAVLAAGLLLLGLVCLLLPRARGQPWNGFLVAFVGGSLLTYAMLEFGGDISATTWLHTAPLAALVALCALGALGIGSYGERWLLALIAAELVWFVGVWIVHVGLQSAFGGTVGHPIYSLDALAAMALAAMVFTARSLQEPRQDQRITEIDDSKPRFNNSAR